MNDNPEQRQDDDKTLGRRRNFHAIGTVSYWRGRLRKNSYTDRHGVKVDIPEFYVRLHCNGVTKRVRLSHKDKDKAAEEAFRLAGKLADGGWEVLNSRFARSPKSLSIDEYLKAYADAARGMRGGPREITILLYSRHLRQLCKFAGVRRLNELTALAIQRGISRYRERARAERREEQSVENSLGIILRNASGCFATRVRASLENDGIKVSNPFAGIQKPQKIEPVVSLDHSILDRIFDELPALRDGDKKAETPNVVQFSKAYGKAHRTKTGSPRRPRWMPIDYSKPHPEAYRAVLLALVLGLRANEIDKARWGWISKNPQGQQILHVRKERDFDPKSGLGRLIWIPDEVYEALDKSRKDASPYILGGSESEKVRVKGWGYRRREVFRVVNDWLRTRGVETGKVKGNPLHRLRKQCGSAVATKDSLFHAQRLLGHSSPIVTSKYYAAQTTLPALTHYRIAG